MTRTVRRGLMLGLVTVAMGASGASAYRPFDGTDAAVAAVRETEIELGPAGFRQDSQETVIVAPGAVYNYGFSAGWELVLEGQAEHPVQGSGRTSRLVGNGVFLKTVVTPGVLQERPGPSIAAEFGLLLPGINGDSGTGASLAGIVSQRWDGVTVHINAAGALSRGGNADFSASGILEGPFDWTCRPVAELFYEHEVGSAESQSLLVGAIWHTREERSYDIGFRTGQIIGRQVAELRAGLTWAFAPTPGG